MCTQAYRKFAQKRGVCMDVVFRSGIHEELGAKVIMLCGAECESVLHIIFVGRNYGNTQGVVR